ncbi:hypothetical protein [Mycobacterium sp. ENV421]|uniref:hypothetical protein n=1 Tax=Mycobacterium sp. ENV421 TaxID=1213407 RepID=UPI003369F4ED
MAYRVVQWGTGAVGVEAIRGILDHPDLELVGVKVYSEAKAGADAGVLAGRDPVGVTTAIDATLQRPTRLCTRLGTPRLTTRLRSWRPGPT